MDDTTHPLVRLGELQLDKFEEGTEEVVPSRYRAKNIRAIDCSLDHYLSLPSSLLTTLGIVDTFLGYFLDKGQEDRAWEIMNDFKLSIQDPEFWEASRAHFVSLVKYDAKTLPRPLRNWLNSHSQEERSREESEDIYNFSRTLRRKGSKQALEDHPITRGLMTTSELGVKALHSITKNPQRRHTSIRDKARLYWMSHQLWRMTPQARRAYMNLTEKEERSLRTVDNLPLSEEPVILDYSPDRNSFTTQRGNSTFPSLVLMKP